jgi:hypothetical protein
LKKVHDYLRHAAECRELARTASSAHRQQLEEMATTWEQLAEHRKRQLEPHGATDDQGLVIEFEITPDFNNDPQKKALAQTPQGGNVRFGS